MALDKARETMETALAQVSDSQGRKASDLANQHLRGRDVLGALKARTSHTPLTLDEVAAANLAQAENDFDDRAVVISLIDAVKAQHNPKMEAALLGFINAAIANDKTVDVFQGELEDLDVHHEDGSTGIILEIANNTKFKNALQERVGYESHRAA